MSWKEMNRSQRVGLIAILAFYTVGVYTVTYHVMMWIFNVVCWIVEKSDEWKRKPPVDKLKLKEV